MMTRVWGDDSWPDAAYERSRGLFDEDILTKVTNEQFIEAYRQRLEAAGFAYVPKPIAMRNSSNAAVYYLFFCSPKAVSAKIVQAIFKRAEQAC
jgi:three-Cys-motif partner protein